MGEETLRSLPVVSCDVERELLTRRVASASGARRVGGRATSAMLLVYRSSIIRGKDVEQKAGRYAGRIVSGWRHNSMCMCRNLVDSFRKRVRRGEASGEPERATTDVQRVGVADVVCGAVGECMNDVERTQRKMPTTSLRVQKVMYSNQATVDRSKFLKEKKKQNVL
jgi:hypothetical protein